jgi:hypothetical protein
MVRNLPASERKGRKHEKLRKTHFWKSSNKLISKSFPASLFYKLFLLFLWLVLPLRTNQTILHILEYRIIEKKWFLLDESNLRSPPLEVYFMKLSSSSTDRAVAKE